MDERIEHFGRTGRHLGVDKMSECWRYKHVLATDFKSVIVRPMPCGDYYPERWESYKGKLSERKVIENND